MANLDDLSATHMKAAHADPYGRSAELIVRDGFLRQSVIALREGAELAEHNSPDAASIHVLSGRVLITSFIGDEDAEVGAGTLQVLTHQRHSVRALADSVFLLTTVTSVGQQDGPERGL